MNLNLKNIDRGGYKGLNESGGSKKSADSQNLGSPQTGVKPPHGTPKSPTNFTKATPTSSRDGVRGSATPRRTGSGIPPATTDNTKVRDIIGNARAKAESSTSDAVLFRREELHFKLGVDSASAKTDAARSSVLIATFRARLARKCTFHDSFENGELTVRLEPGEPEETLDTAAEIWFTGRAFLDFFTLEKSSRQVAEMLRDPMLDHFCTAVLDALVESRRVDGAKPFKIKRENGQVGITAIQPKAFRVAIALAPLLAQTGDEDAAIALIEAVHADALERAKMEPDVLKAKKVAKAARLTLIRSTLRALIGTRDANPAALRKAQAYLDELAKSRKDINRQAALVGRAALANRMLRLLEAGIIQEHEAADHLEILLRCATASTDREVMEHGRWALDEFFKLNKAPGENRYACFLGRAELAKGMRKLHEAGFIRDDEAGDHLVAVFRCATASTDEKVKAHGGWAVAELIKLNKASGDNRYASLIAQCKQTHKAALSGMQQLQGEADENSRRTLKLDNFRSSFLNEGFYVLRDDKITLPFEDIVEFCGLALDPRESSKAYVEAESLCGHLQSNPTKLDPSQINKLVSLLTKIARRHAQDGAIDHALTALAKAHALGSGKQADRRIIDNGYGDVFSICRQMLPVTPASSRKAVKALERFWVNRCLNRLSTLPLDAAAPRLGLLVQLFANGLGDLSHEEQCQILSPIAIKHNFEDAKALLEHLGSVPHDNNDVPLLTNHSRDETLELLAQVPGSFQVGKLQEILGITPCLLFAKSAASLAQLTPENIRIEQRRQLLENVPKLLGHATYEKYDKSTATSSSPGIRENHRIAWALHELMRICTPEECVALDALMKAFSDGAAKHRSAMQDIQANIDFRIAIAEKNGVFIANAIEKYPCIIIHSADIAADRANLLLDAVAAILDDDAQKAAEVFYVASAYEQIELPSDLQARAESALGKLMDALPIEPSKKIRSQTHVLLGLCEQLSKTAGWVPLLEKLARRANNLQADPKYFGDLCCSLANAHFNQGDLEQGLAWLNALVKAGGKFKIHRAAASKLRESLAPHQDKPQYQALLKLIGKL